MRPFSEINNLVKESIEVKKSSPSESYEMVQKIGKGGYAHVFQVKRKSDNQMIACKVVKDVKS